jgi:hypothetical protein
MKKPDSYPPEREPTSCTVRDPFENKGAWTVVDHTNATLRPGMHVRCGPRRWRIEKMALFAAPLESLKQLKASLLLVGPDELPKPGDVLEFEEGLG